MRRASGAERIEPDAVARQVIDAVKKNLFWVICPPALAQVTSVRSAAIKADLAAAENRFAGRKRQ